jgi:hypothetical protein
MCPRIVFKSVNSNISVMKGTRLEWTEWGKNNFHLLSRRHVVITRITQQSVVKMADLLDILHLIVDLRRI